LGSAGRQIGLDALQIASASMVSQVPQVSSANRSDVREGEVDLAVTNHDSAPQEAFEDELDAALRSLCLRAICPTSIPATSTNAT
jgi:hypothetical protein